MKELQPAPSPALTPSLPLAHLMNCIPLAVLALWVYVGAFNPLNAYGTPNANLWVYFSQHDRDSRLRVDHSQWDALLKRHVKRGVDGINRIHYRGFLLYKSRAGLKKYISQMQRVRVTALSRDEQIPYWLNLFNASVVNFVVQNFPVPSIRKVGGILSVGPWSKKILTLESMRLSLNDIEHRILRPLSVDSRVHYGLNGATLGNANILPVAFTASNTPALLSQSAKDFVNHHRGVRVVGNKLHLSSIYHWYLKDFGGNMDGLITHLRKFADPNLRASLAKVETMESYEHDFDWQLNSVYPSRTGLLRCIFEACNKF